MSMIVIQFDIKHRTLSEAHTNTWFCANLLMLRIDQAANLSTTAFDEFPCNTKKVTRLSESEWRSSFENFDRSRRAPHDVGIHHVGHDASEVGTVASEGG